MKLPSYLYISRHNVYLFRRRIPDCIQKHFNTNEIRQSLKTKDLKRAISDAKIISIHSDLLFYRLKNNMSVDDLESNFKQLIKSAKQKLHLQEKNEELDSAFTKSRLDYIKLSKQHDREIELIKSFGVIKASDAPLSKTPNISELINEFFIPEEITRRLDKPATVRKDRDALKMFIKIIGDKPISNLDQTDAATFSKKVVNHNLDDKSRAVSTINNYLGSVSKFSAWVTAHRSELGHTKLNFAGLRHVKRKMASEERDMFELEEVQRIFNHPKFKLAKKHDTEKYWLICIAAYSGMRLEEIAQLNPKTDVYYIKKLLVFDINENEDKSVKNSTSVRIVPVHSKLVELGFKDYLDSISGKHNSLFPNTKTRDGRKGKNIGKRAGYFIKNIIGIEGKTLHSFRHTLTTMLKRARVDESLAAAILGHAHGGISYTRYGKHHLPEVLSDTIEKYINFDIKINL